MFDKDVFPLDLTSFPKDDTTNDRHRQPQLQQPVLTTTNSIRQDGCHCFLFRAFNDSSWFWEHITLFHQGCSKEEKHIECAKPIR